MTLRKENWRLVLDADTFKASEEDKQTDVIYADFSIAFGKADHNLLIFRLKCLGFADNMVSWLRSYTLVAWSEIKGMSLNLKKFKKLSLSCVGLLPKSCVINNYALKSI